MDELKVFAERLKQKRTEKQISLRELALKTGLSPTTVSSYERGDKSPSLNNVALIAKYLDVSIDWLCGFEKGDKGVTTLKDVAEMLFAIADCPNVEFYTIVSPEGQTEYCIGGKQRYEFNGRILRDGTSLLFQNFLESFMKFYNLYRDNAIDDEVYGLWKEKELKKLEQIPVTDDDEIPF